MRCPDTTAATGPAACPPVFVGIAHKIREPPSPCRSPTTLTIRASLEAHDAAMPCRETSQRRAREPCLSYYTCISHLGKLGVLSVADVQVDDRREKAGGMHRLNIVNASRAHHGTSEASA